jgi:hypothetical protein
MFVNIIQVNFKFLKIKITPYVVYVWTASDVHCEQGKGTSVSINDSSLSSWAAI